MLQFTDIVGQDEAIMRLQEAMRSHRAPHAYIFAGPEGVGRRTTAEALAATLLCHNAAEVDSPEALQRAGMDKIVQACGKCSDCRTVADGTHSDYHVIRKELAHYHQDANVRNRKMQELSIDVIRSFLIELAGRTSAGGRGKVFVVLEAELMSTAAQNALLKTLEEPPDGVTIILVCSRPERLLPTTLSRCSMVRFVPLTAEFVASRLSEAGADKEQARFWAAFTGGSLGRAMRLSQKDLYETKTEIIRRLASPAPGEEMEFGEELAGIMDNFAKDMVSDTSQQEGPELAKTLADRRAAAVLLGIISSAYRDAMKIAAAAEADLTNSDQADAVSAIAARFDTVRLADIIEQMGRFEQLLWRNLNAKIIWSNVAVTCASGAPLNV